MPTTALENSDGRVGYVGSAKSLAASSDPSAVAPLGAATVQQTVDALNAMGIRVLGMGPNAAPTSDPGPSSGPSVWESAIARLTGALDSSGQPLVFSTSVTNDQLTTAIVDAVTATTTAPVDVGLSTTALPNGLTFHDTPTVVSAVALGGTAPFSVTLAVPSVPFNGTFDIQFIDVHSDAVLGVIPVTIDIPDSTPTGTSSGQSTTGTIPGVPPTVTAGERLGFHWRPTTLVFAFSEALDPTTAQNTKNYVVVGPRGNVVPVDSAVYDATTYTVTLHPHERLKLRAKYVLTINGAAPSGVASDAGALLDGTDNGSPGSDFVATAFWFHLKARYLSKKSQKSTQLPKPNAVADQARAVSIVRSHRARSHAPVVSTAG